MSSLSVIVLTCNVEDTLAECLQSAAFADELIVFDSGSTDSTLQIATDNGAKIVQQNDWPGFGRQRQLAQQHACKEWVLMLDADEVITPALRQSIEQAIQQAPDSLYALARLSWCFGRFIRHSGWYPDWCQRLYPRAKAQFNDALVHEKLEYSSELQLKKLHGDLLHYTYRDLNHYLVKSAHYAKAWADQRQQRGKTASLSQAFLHAIGCFIKMYLLRAGFLDGRAGLLLALLSAHSTYVKYADLWLRTQPKRQA